MIKSFRSTQLVLMSMFIILSSCQTEQVTPPSEMKDNKAHKEAFTSTLQRHLDAVTSKDLEALKNTLSPEGKLHFMLIKRETTHTVSSFVKFHEEWFKDPNWSFETKILTTDVGPEYGIAITEIVYREPERDGKPYFNRMAVSYGLQFIDGKWYVIKDHATSIEKSMN